MPELKSIALLGATSILGPPILTALLSNPHFTKITILQRASSKSNPLADLSSSSSPSAKDDPRLTLQTLDDALSLSSLTSALEGTDALISTIRITDPSLHLRVATAAATAGVQRLIPADFGSCDASTAQAQHYVPLFANKSAVQAHLVSLAQSGEFPSFSWTSIVCGHFFDWGLGEGFLHVWLREQRADILDEGTLLSSMSTLRRVADAVVAVLLRGGGDDEALRNRVLFVQSFCVSQVEVLAAVERAIGGKLDVTYVKSEDFLRAEKAKADGGDRHANENLVWALGALDGDWRKKEGFAMRELGLEDEDLDEVVGAVVERSK